MSPFPKKRPSLRGGFTVFIVVFFRLVIIFKLFWFFLFYIDYIHLLYTLKLDFLVFFYLLSMIVFLFLSKNIENIIQGFLY
jgi:hypothetical protein